MLYALFQKLQVDDRQIKSSNQLLFFVNKLSLSPTLLYKNSLEPKSKSGENVLPSPKQWAKYSDPTNDRPKTV